MCALVLELMRVPWEKIEQDYLLSNVYLTNSAREALIEHYGSVEAYVKAFGVADGTLEPLRGALLE